MEEAQRLLTVSVWKLYRCRVRRGGLRLHRSLQLSLLVRAARHRYLSARAAAGSPPAPGLPGAAGAIPAPELPGAAAAIPGPAVNGSDPGTGAAQDCGERSDPGTGAARGDPGTGAARGCGHRSDPRSGWPPERGPPGARTHRARDRATPRTEQEWGNPLRDCAGDHRNPPGGAPRSEWHRGCPPGPPSEDPPRAGTGTPHRPRTR
ncbi:immediate early response gene 5 protein-like [Passer domesticus]|uniref:immediate early response gene 5 protein-like n=1 Tax=Passer domesticus TaxID=48849 RepID=UPI0030FF0752